MGHRRTSVLHRHRRVRLTSERACRDSAAGRAFVAFYYRHSPAIAQHIAKRAWLRVIVRWRLAPLVYAIAYPALAAPMAVAAGLSATILWRLRRTQRRRRSRATTG